MMANYQWGHLVGAVAIGTEGNCYTRFGLLPTLGYLTRQ